MSIELANLPATIGFYTCELSSLPASLAQTITLPANLSTAVESRQREYLAGRYCALKALKAIGKICTPPEQDLQGAPCWPQGYVGSISHNHHHAMAAVALQQHHQTLGIDIETCFHAPELHADIFTRSEQDRWSRDLDGWLPTLVFSAKESLYKALFPLTRVQFYFHDAELVAINPHGFTLRLCTTLNSHWTRGACINGSWSRHGDEIITLIAPPARPR